MAAQNRLGTVKTNRVSWWVCSAMIAGTCAAGFSTTEALAAEGSSARVLAAGIHAVRFSATEALAAGSRKQFAVRMRTGLVRLFTTKPLAA